MRENICCVASHGDKSRLRKPARFSVLYISPIYTVLAGIPYLPRTAKRSGYHVEDNIRRSAHISGDSRLACGNGNYVERGRCVPLPRSHPTLEDAGERQGEKARFAEGTGEIDRIFKKKNCNHR